MRSLAQIRQQTLRGRPSHDVHARVRARRHELFHAIILQINLHRIVTVAGDFDVIDRRSPIRQAADASRELDESPTAERSLVHRHDDASERLALDRDVEKALGEVLRARAARGDEEGRERERGRHRSAVHSRGGIGVVARRWKPARRGAAAVAGARVDARAIRREPRERGGHARECAVRSSTLDILDVFANRLVRRSLENR